MLSELFELRLSIQDNSNLGIHAGDNKVTGVSKYYAVGNLETIVAGWRSLEQSYMLMV